MDPQLVSTGFAWLLVAATGLIAFLVLRTHRGIDWWASAAFAVGTLLLAIAAAVTATNVLVTGPNIGPNGRDAIIVLRAVATALFLGVAMDVTGRPRWVGRFVERITKGGRS